MPLRLHSLRNPRDPIRRHQLPLRGLPASTGVSWFTVPSGDFHLTGGEPTRFASSEHATRSFCPRCGTALSFQRNDTLQEIDITTCSLDEPGRVPPRDQTHTRSKVAWVELDPKLPAFAEARSDG